MNYVGYLVNEHNLVPYSEIFETSMPGTFLFHSMLGKLLGYTDTAVRTADIFLLSLSLLLIFLIVKPFSKLQGAFAAFLFGLIYLSFGPKMALQRDFLGLIPILAAVWLVARNQTGGKNAVLTSLVIGGLVGISSSFKPHQVIILPVLTCFMASHPRIKNLAGWLRTLLISLIGFSVTFSIPIIWVWQKGGLNSFMEMFWNYLPLHTQIGHNFQVVMWPEKIWYSVSGLIILNDHLLMLLLSLLGFYLYKNSINFETQRSFRLIVSSCVVFFFYTAITGQFWYYHWIPFLVFASMGASFLLKARKNEVALKAFVPIGLLLFALPLQVNLSEQFKRQISGIEMRQPLDGVPDQIGSFLKKNLKPGDRVQSLDWVNGAIHGMLQARALTSTPFLYDYHFYHHVSRPFIKELRKRFITQLSEHPPEYVIYVFFKSMVTGEDTTQEFPELEKFLLSNYQLTFKDEKNRFGIFKKKD